MTALKLAGLRLRALIRKSPRTLIALLAVIAAFIGVGIYTGGRALWPLLLVWWPWLVAGAVLPIALGIWWLWWRLPKQESERLRPTMPDPKARADVEDNFRKTIGQVLGGAAVLFGAGIAYLQFTQQQQSSRDLLISNQMAKGFELLGKKEKDEVMLRLGGIYTLEGIMNTSDDYYYPIIEALCAFVRDGTKNETGDGPPATDIQAALTVIGGRRAIDGRAISRHISERRLVSNTQLNLKNARIPKANLVLLDLKFVDLSGADLRGARFGVDVGYFSLGADLTDATLIDADLTGADLNGVQATRVGWKGAILRDTDLTSADLTGAWGLTQAQLDQACARKKPNGLDKAFTFPDDKPCPENTP
jgi:hypothetical protein